MVNRIWKGQYGMTTGGEVGSLYKGPDLNIPGVFNGTFYYCVKDEDMINISFAFRKTAIFYLLEVITIGGLPDLSLLSFHNLRNSQWTLSLIYMTDRWLKLLSMA